MRSITMCRTTVLAAVAALPALAFAAPASAPEATETEVGAWIVGDASFESPRFTKALRIDGLDAADVASRFASMPAGRRAAYSERILAGFVGDEGDRVVVSGRITDHVGPWIDAASKRTRLELEQLAKELASRGLSIDALLLGGENPLSAEKLDTADDLVWMAIRNDRRFEEIASAELSLAGAMSPSNPQWRAWNEFADVTIAKAIDESVATPLREAGAAASIAVPVTVGIGRSELDAMPIAIRMHGSFDEANAGGATTAFDVLADELELAVKASRGGRTLQPWIRPYSHAGTRGERSAVAGTLLWDELVRHATVLGKGRVVYEETRSRDLAAPDASRFAEVLDGVAEEFAGGASISSADASIRRGQGFVAVGVPTASGETLWRISFSPGIGGVDVEIDGGGLRVERRRGESGAWLRTAADSRIEFFDRAFARNEATTGGGLLAAPTSKPRGKVGPLLSGGPEGGTTLVGSGVGDLNGDGVVDGADLAIHLAGGGDSGWGGVSDLNGDGASDGADLAITLSGGLATTWSGTGWDDLNGDGASDGADLAITLSGGLATTWNGTGWDDLNGDGVVDGADLSVWLSGAGGVESPTRTSKRQPEVTASLDSVDPADLPSTIDGDQSGPLGGIDPTIPVTPIEPAQGDLGQSPLIVMYDRITSPDRETEALGEGFLQYVLVHQNADPSCRDSGVIDPALVVEFIRTHYGDSPSGWGILDFENPFLDRLNNGPSDPHYQQTVDTLVNLMQAVRAEFPAVKWAYYGMPQIRYWGPTGSGWDQASPEAREAVIAQRLEAYRPVLMASDWLAPSVYDRYEFAAFTEQERVSLTPRERAWRHYTMEVCNRFNQTSGTPPRRVMPLVSPFFWREGRMEFHMKTIGIDEILRDQVEPLVANGADGIALWAGMRYFITIATAQDGLSVSQPDAREAMLRNFLGSPPQQWQDPAIRSGLMETVGAMYLEVLRSIRERGNQIRSASVTNG